MEQSPLSRNSSRSEALIVALAALLTFVSALRNGFVLDDLIHVTSSSAISTLSGTLVAFFEPMFPGSLYRPLVTLSYGVTYALFGHYSPIYHLTNLLLHAWVAVLIYLLLAKLFDNRIGFWTSLLFALHPVHTEVVANVSGRAELLCHAFGLSFLYFSLSKREHWKARQLCGLSLCLLGSVLSKESGVVYPLLFALCVLYFEPPVKLSRLWGRLGSAVAALCAYAILRIVSLGGLMGTLGSTSFVDNPLASSSAFSRVLSAVTLLGKYVFLCLFPYPLSADYSFAHLGPISSPLSSQEWLMLLHFFLLLVVTLIGVWKRSLFGFAAAWFFMSFAVTANVLFPIGTIFGERLVYLPSVGLCLIIVGLVFGVCRTFAPALLVAALSLAAYRSFIEIQKWASQESLFEYQMTVSPNSVKTLVNYSVVKRNAGQADEALQLLGRAFEMYPDYPEIALGMGAVWIHKGNLGQAEFWLRRCLESNPAHIEALNLLGRLLLNQGRNEEAKHYLSNAREVQPKHLASSIALMATCLNLADLPCAAQLRYELSTIAADDDEFKKLEKIMNGGKE